jgi:hypothetical protein
MKPHFQANSRPKNILLYLLAPEVSSYFPAEQGLPGRQIGIGSPDLPAVPAEQLTPGLQGGMGSPAN